MSNYKIDKLKVENFRGFSGSKEFSIESDRPVVLLYGNNGFGKTSFFDAVEWGLTGKLARYEGSSKERNEYIMLRNQFASNSTNPSKVSISLDQGNRLTRTVRQRGQGDYNEGNLNENLIKQLVRQKWAGVVDFGHAFSLSHILTQELVSSFIRSTKDTERYASIVSLFGLDGYAMFDPKFNEISKAAEQELEKINNETERKTIEIIRNKEFLTSGDIDGNALRAELANYLSVNMHALPELKELLSGTQKRNSDLASNLEVLKADLQGVSFLEQNWQSGLGNNQKIIALGKTLEELPILMESCNSLAACQWIISSKEAYLKYSKEKNAESRLEAELSVLIQSPEGRLLQVSAIDTDGDITPLYVLGSALGGNVKEQIEKLKGIINSRNDKKSELEKVEQIVAAKLGLEKRLIQLAKEFFVDNPNAKHCPVCNNVIDANSLLNDLQARIAQDSSDFFKEAIDNRTKLQDEQFQLSDQIRTITKSVIDSLNAARLQAAKKREELQKQLDIAKKLSETGKNIESWLSYLKIDISQIDMTSSQLKQTIQASPAFVKDQFGKDFYKNRQDNLTSELESLQKQNEYFNQLVATYSLTSAEEVSQKKNVLNIQNKDLLKLKASLSRVLEIIINLQKDDRCNLARNRIIELEKEIYPLKEMVQKLKLIPQHCKDLKQKSRNLIKEDTRKLLDAYGTTMDEIYSHLNPHSYLEKLDFRIDDNNPSNNRLILEVFQRDGDIKMNPTYTFSSSQTNVVAISIFLGIALRQQWSAFNALFLDDPIQNMDDINVHSFVDIIRSVIRDTDKQFFISTHDERVFNFMKRKFRESAQVFHFTGYGEFVKELC